MKPKPTMADAEATLRKGIREGITWSRGPVPEPVIDAVFNVVTAADVRWALVMIGEKKETKRSNVTK